MHLYIQLTPLGPTFSGNDYLHLLTSARTYELRVDLADFDNETRFAEYSNFTIASAADNYTLDVDGYDGNAGLPFLIVNTT